MMPLLPVRRGCRSTRGVETNEEETSGLLPRICETTSPLSWDGTVRLKPRLPDLTVTLNASQSGY